MKNNREIKLATFLKEKFIELDLKAKTKDRLILEMVERISRSARIRNKGILLKAILEREKLGSTAIGNGVAIPHVKLKQIKKLLIFFGRSSEGVDFEALDGERTFIFFLVLSPQEEVGLHLKILAQISRLVKDKFIVEQLKKAPNKKRILEIISHFEGESK